MKIGIAAYGFPFSIGFVGGATASPSPPPMDAAALIDLAASRGLSGVEIPFGRMLPDLSDDTVDRLRAKLEAANLSLVVDTGVVDEDELRVLLPQAARAGARLVRVLLSTILEGNRAAVAGGWDNYLVEMCKRLLQLQPTLEQYDITLAIENHQDATSDDLLRLCEAGGPRCGVTLDAANPLSVAEEPLAFAKKLGPLIRNVHLKDYQMFATPSGFRLVRCALGQGVIPFPELLSLLQEVAPNVYLHIELAALYARHIRLFEDEWWQGFPPRYVYEVLPVLKLFAQHAQPPDKEWRTPLERGAPADEIIAYEQKQFETSVQYLQSIGAL